MNQKILKFQPVFLEKIWGGDGLKRFGYDISKENVGECWGISARSEAVSIVSGGILKGKSLKELWENNPELFGGKTAGDFPLLVKIIDAARDLSVQVHPDDVYAGAHEHGSLGKTECWYVLNCEDDAQIVYGVNAASKEELDHMIDKGMWKALLNTVKVKKGDVIYIKSGTVHALKAGITVLEVQQNSDITYRLYDYDRADKNGSLRQLHIKQAKDVIDTDAPKNIIEDKSANEVNTLLKTEYFTLEKYISGETLHLENKYPFLLLSLIDGEGTITSGDESCAVKKGDHLMITSCAKKFELNGGVTVIAAHI